MRCVGDLSKDIQSEYESAEYTETIKIRGYEPGLSDQAGQIKNVMGIVNRAERPVFLVGRGVHISHAQAETTNVPVITIIMGKGAIPKNHSLYIGNLGINGSYAANSGIG